MYDLLLGMTSLKQLDLSNVAISNSAIISLKGCEMLLRLYLKIAALRSLTWLDLSNTQIKPTGLISVLSMVIKRLVS